MRAHVMDVAAFALLGPSVGWLTWSAALALTTRMNPERLDPQQLLGVSGVFEALLVISFLVGVVPALLAGVAFNVLRRAKSVFRFAICIFIGAIGAGTAISLIATPGSEPELPLQALLIGGLSAGLVGWGQVALAESSHWKRPGKNGGSSAPFSVVGLRSDLLRRRRSRSSFAHWVVAQLNMEVRCRASVRIRISDEFQIEKTDNAGETLRTVTDELCVELERRLVARGVPANQIIYNVTGEFLCADPPLHTAASLVAQVRPFDIDREWRDFRYLEANHPTYASREGPPPRRAFTVGGVAQGFFDDRGYRSVVEKVVEANGGVPVFGSSVWYKADIWIIALDVRAWNSADWLLLPKRTASTAL